MTLPSFEGYSFDSHIYAARRLVILWLSKPDYELGLLQQAQLTLTNASMALGTFEFADCFPPLISVTCTLKEPTNMAGKLMLSFEGGGELHYCFQSIDCFEFTRPLKFIRSP